MQLPQSLAAWGRPEFVAILRDELGRQRALSRLLQRGLTFGTVALLDELKLSLLSATEEAQTLTLKLGVHYTSIITGCQCTDDPSPASLLPEYVELALRLDRISAEAMLELAS